MKLWMLTQDRNTGYDTYDSCIVAAPTAAAAKDFHPRSDTPQFWWLEKDQFGPLDTWAHPNDVTVRLLGEAVPNTKAGVVLASFNAG